MSNAIIERPIASSVRKAREALQARANEILDLMLLNAKQAAASGDFETAQKTYQYLLDHTPGEDGQRVVEISVDKPKQVEARPTGPAIQIIGIGLGGVNRPQLEEANIIDITPESND